VRRFLFGCGWSCLQLDECLHPHTPAMTLQGTHLPYPPPQILVRDPYSVVQSFSKVLHPTLQELGYAALAEIYSEMRALG